MKQMLTCTLFIGCAIYITLIGISSAGAQTSIDLSRISNLRSDSSRSDFVLLAGFHFSSSSFKSGKCQGENCLGGYSGLFISEDGRTFTAISDQRHWLEADIETQNDLPTGLKNIRVTKITDNRLPHNPEALQWHAKSRRWLVSFEDDKSTRQEILAWATADKKFGPPINLGHIPNSLLKDRGLEAVALLPDLSALLFAEGKNDSVETVSLVWFLPKLSTPDATSAQHALVIQKLAWHQTDFFQVTDAFALPGGGVLVLERRFLSKPVTKHEGITRIPATRLKWVKQSEMNAVLCRDQSEAVCPEWSKEKLPVLKAEVLMALEGTISEPGRPHSPVDNMEGLSVRCVHNKAWVYVISDDNPQLDTQQRTILLVFESNNDELNKAACITPASQ